MNHDRSDGEAMLRWRDRPAGGSLAEDRAAALLRGALVPDVFPLGLADHELLAIQEHLRPPSRARPPRWLRPALVAALLSVSVASVMGYQTGWLAPLRERLRFRSIPTLMPEPAPHFRRRAAPAPIAPAPQAAPDVKSEVAPVRKLALAHHSPVSPPPATPEEPAASGKASPGASEEILALRQAVSLLRGRHDAPAALAALDAYLARFPAGVLIPEARVARVDALLMLGRADEALRALDRLPLDAHRRSTELQLIRGELRARSDCGRAEPDFTAVLARAPTPPFEERALYGRAACRSAQGNASGAATDLRAYVDRFPHGAHADWARRWLEHPGR